MIVCKCKFISRLLQRFLFLKPGTKLFRCDAQLFVSHQQRFCVFLCVSHSCLDIQPSCGQKRLQLFKYSQISMIVSNSKYTSCWKATSEKISLIQLIHLIQHWIVRNCSFDLNHTNTFTIQYMDSGWWRQCECFLWLNYIIIEF